MFYFNIPVDWSAVAKGTVAVLGSAPLSGLSNPSRTFWCWVLPEPTSASSPATSPTSAAVSAVAQEVAGVREGSHEGEIVSTLAIVATQIMLTLAALSGAIFVTIVVKFLPKSFLAAFDWLLPSIWGRHCDPVRPAQVAVCGGGDSFLNLYRCLLALPIWSHVPIIVFFMAILALKLYSKKIWLIAERRRRLPPGGQKNRPWNGVKNRLDSFSRHSGGSRIQSLQSLQIFWTPFSPG